MDNSNPGKVEDPREQTSGENDRKLQKAIRKQLESEAARDSKAFMDMLRTVSRNHYTLTQMVDRKARILLSANVLILSAIIGQAVAARPAPDFATSIMVFAVGLTATFSMVLSLIAVLPARYGGNLTETQMRNFEGNPLYFDNFVQMSEEQYRECLVSLASERRFIYSAMIQDIYHVGVALKRKRSMLRTSLILFVAGLSISFVVASTVLLQNLTLK